MKASDLSTSAKFRLQNKKWILFHRAGLDFGLNIFSGKYYFQLMRKCFNHKVLRWKMSDIDNPAIYAFNIAGDMIEAINVCNRLEPLPLHIAT